MRLQVENLSKDYRGGVHALRDLRLDLAPGVLGLLGPDGAGKSTLMRILATITQPTTGRVLWNGVDTARNPDALRSVLGFLPQDFGVYPNLSAMEFLEYLAAVKGIAAVPARNRIAELLELLNLTEPARGAVRRAVSRELRLALQGLKWWWFAVAAGLLIAQFVAPLEISRGPLLAVAWIWPTLIWSAMGAREKRFDTRALLFSSACFLPRQLLACLAAGFVVAPLTGSGTGLRLLAARDFSGAAAWLAGAFLLPSAAVFLGVISGTSKCFDGLYVALWYIGPMNHTRGLDFIGAANGPQMLRYAAIYAIIAVAAVVFALMARSRQLCSG